MEEQEKEQKEPAEQTEHAEQEPISIKEERIRKIAYFYYSRPDVRKAMFEFSKNRECVPRYFEGFGKRPDVFHYDSDILGFAKSGATSFHCSEELWNDALNLSTESTPEEQKKIRTGWDLLIDVDSKYLDYSKIYAEVLIDVLRSVGIKNIGIKFSGSRGFHFIIPWKAFPEEMSGGTADAGGVSTPGPDHGGGLLAPVRPEAEPRRPGGPALGHRCGPGRGL